MKFEKLLGNVTPNYLGLGGSRGKTISNEDLRREAQFDQQEEVEQKKSQAWTASP